MESENRSYRRSGSELFICFTSRNSSSIKVCSKSAQSPGRNSGKFSNSSSSSLSCSLSRRLRSNGSIKGSPMFPTGGGSQKKKGGSSSETATAEPSSPKVTCIGQVRVKTKKQGQKFRKKKSKRRDVSFRKTDQDGGNFHSSQQLQQQQECLPHRNQRWVHLPLSICEALRAFGAEFSCLLPCKPSCLTSGGGMKKRRQTSSTERNTSSCRPTFEKCVMTSLHESGHLQNSHNNETELVVSRKEEMVGEIEMHISEEKRVSICNEVEAEQEEEEEEEEGRVSICIPPRNALLLMRCRSEPLRMSALANHFWESPVKDKKEEDLQQRKQVLVAEEDDDEDDSGSDSDEEELEDGDEEKDSDDDDDEVEDVSEVKLQLKHPKEENTDISLEAHNEEENQDYAEEMVVKKIEEDVNENGLSSIEPLKEEEQEILKIEEKEEDPRLQMREEEKELIIELKEERIESRRPSTSSRRVSFSSCTRSIHEDDEEEDEEEGEEEERFPEAEPIKVDGFEGKVNNATEEKASKPRISVEKRGTVKINNQNDNEEEELPDCLLLMMCEPKLSMEVSKETWVCSTDFIRYRPERRVVQNNNGGGRDNLPTKKRNSTDSKGRHSLDSKSRLSTDSKSRLSTDSNPGNGRPPLHSKHQKPPTPPRRSISKPTPPPSVAKPTPAKPVPPVEASTSPSSAMVTMIEQKLVNAIAYEPLVLTRCKSEPMQSSAKLAPEACFWKNMKLEPHAQGPPNLGVGAATGIGF